MKRAFMVMGLLAWGRTAAAAGGQELPCGAVEAGVISLDGMTDDWTDVPGIEAGGGDSNLSFTVKCNVDAKSLYVLVDVRDDYFARTKLARPGEDHVVLGLGSGKLLVFPGDQAAIKDKVVWAPHRPARGVKSIGARQQRGWAVELKLPLGQIPGFRRGAPLRFTAEVDDCDSKATGKTARTLATGGVVAFAEAASSLDAFLREQHLTSSSIYFDRPIATGRGTGARAILAGRYLAIVTDEYVYTELPFHDRRDLRDARLVDLAGDGREALVLRYLEHGGGGSREVLAAYRADGQELQRVFAHEVGKATGAARVEDKVSFVRRGRATDLLVEAGPASGFTPASYHESPAGDMLPILLPWSDERRARYQFSGNEYYRAH